jgi:hypothetical protein
MKERMAVTEERPVRKLLSKQTVKYEITLHDPQ